MRTLTPLLVALLGALWLSGCSKPKDHQASVKLVVDGKRHDYDTTAAHIETRSDPGTYSLYLRPQGAEKNLEQPFVTLRTYSGSPVRRLSLHYLGKGDTKRRRYECFVPGKLADGRETLGWKKADGKKRDRTETGEASCKAQVVRKGQELHFSFDATLNPAIKRKKKKGKKAKVDPEAKGKSRRISGAAVVKL